MRCDEHGASRWGPQADCPVSQRTAKKQTVYTRRLADRFAPKQSLSAKSLQAWDCWAGCPIPSGEVAGSKPAMAASNEATRSLLCWANQSSLILERIEAMDDGQKVFERERSARIPRDHM